MEKQINVSIDGGVVVLPLSEYLALKQKADNQQVTVEVKDPWTWQDSVYMTTEIDLEPMREYIMAEATEWVKDHPGFRVRKGTSLRAEVSVVEPTEEYKQTVKANYEAKLEAEKQAEAQKTEG